ncbi:MAG: hypothetical protein COA63_006220, partial [Methylophaga sp.]|nr:hypothetical protein [Methylophaga sp.]
TNFLGENELVDAIVSGDVDLASIKNEDLPESIQAMPTEEQAIFIRQKAEKRDNLGEEMKILAEKRNDYLKKQVAADGGRKDSFDAKIFGSIQAQTKEKGLIYSADSIKY